MKKTTKSTKTKPAQLSLLNPKCAGIDIGAAEIFVCIAKSPSEQEVRSFPTFTADLKRMIAWLQESGVESVAMESTGVYWISPYEMLDEAGFEVLLVNARAGEKYYEQQYQARVVANLTRRAEEFGFVLVPVQSAK
jgi:transposase